MKQQINETIFAILGMLLRKNVWILIYLFTDYNNF